MIERTSQTIQRIAALATLAGGLSIAAAQARAQGVGVPKNGFPSWDERTLLILINRDRADPQTSLSSCTAADCPDKGCYAAVPPVGWDYDLNRSARFHSTNLVASHAPLQHPSPCLLQSDIATTFPATCDGSPTCACAGNVKCDCATGCSCDSSLSSCVTQPFDRIHAFNPTGCAENIAAGYMDPVQTEQGFLLETCSCCTSTCPPQFTFCPNGDVNGHRVSILNGGNSSVGTGEAPNGTRGCYQGHWYTQDYGCGAAVPTKLVAGTHFPKSGTSFTFWANWFDTAEPSQAAVVIDGTVHVMTHDRGTVTGNATYATQQTLASGCHPYYFEFRDTSATYTVPSVGTYLAGDNCTSDYAGPSTGTTGGTSGGTSTGGTTGGATSGGGSGTGTSSGGNGGGPDAGLGTVVSSGCACTTTARSDNSAGLLMALGLLVLGRRRK